jgi:hypothetical protein
MPEIIVSSLAIVGGMFPAYNRPFFVNAAFMVFCQEPAFIGDVKKPFSFLDKYRHLFMRKIPPYLLQILLCSWRIYLKSEVLAAFGPAFAASCLRRFFPGPALFFHFSGLSSRVSLSENSFLSASRLYAYLWQGNLCAEAYGLKRRKARL